jgi:hypothetical protein
VRLAEPDWSGRNRPTELSLRFGADLPLVFVGNTVWRIKRRPVWNMLAAGGRLIFCADGQGDLAQIALA